LFFSFVTFFNLCLSECIDCFNFTGLANINKLELGRHLNHHATMFEQMWSEEILKNKKFLFKLVLSLLSILLFDCLLPHSHKLPFFKLLEKRQHLNMIIRITFNKPLSKRNEFNRGIIFVKSETFSTKSVVFCIILMFIA
jgi:hypothetical protein